MDSLHDGQENNCSGGDLYVMSGGLWVSQDDDGDNRRSFTFSNCSMVYFDARIEHLNRCASLTRVQVDLTGDLLDLTGVSLDKYLTQVLNKYII